MPDPANLPFSAEKLLGYKQSLDGAQFQRNLIEEIKRKSRYAKLIMTIAILLASSFVVFLFPKLQTAIQSFSASNALANLDFNVSPASIAGVFCLGILLILVNYALDDL